MRKHAPTRNVGSALLGLLAATGLFAQTIHDLSVTSVTPPANPVAGVAGNYVVALGGTSGAPGVTVTVVFTPFVTVNLGSSIPTTCSRNSATDTSIDPSVTVSCPATGLTSVTINATPTLSGPLSVIAGIIGTDFDSDVTNNSKAVSTTVGVGAPTITAVVPASGPTSGGFSVVITGTSFTGATSVTFGGTAAGFSVVGSTQINATAPAHAAGAATVSVTTPQGTANLSGFTYLAPTKFFALPSCRVFDTRNANGPYGGPALAANAARAFTITGQCGVPVGAKAIVGNFTTVGPTTVGTITAYPTTSPRPVADVVGYATNQTIAGLATLVLDLNGSLSVYPTQASGTVNLILDVSGYFQ